MTNFVKVGDSEYVINVDLIAYVDTDLPIHVLDERDGETSPKIAVIFAAVDSSGDPLAINLYGDNATRFMAMLDRQTGAW